MKKSIFRRFIVLALVLVMTGAMTCTESFAYFNRGSVNVSVGKSSVSVAQGGSTSVSVSLSPSSSSQLPGCGMAECPQICGEKDCLDANGECTCNGTTYKTYYASASVSSSNTGVATASYSGGAVYIKGISPGSATITVKGSLRQFTSTSKTISVNVTASTASSSKPTSYTAQSGEASAKPVNGSAAATESKSKDKNDKDKNTKETDASQTMESDRGKIIFVQIPDGKTGKSELESIKGEEQYVDFQKKDEAETILYAWEFFGKDVNEPRDMDLNLMFSRTPFDGCKYGTETDSVYIQRGDAEALPGEASTYIRVTDWFSDSDKLFLYSFNEEDGVNLIEEDLAVTNGYVTSKAMFGEADRYILSTEKWNVEAAEVEAEGGVNPWLIGGIAIAVVIIAAAAIIVVRRKKANGID